MAGAMQVRGEAVPQWQSNDLVQAEKLKTCFDYRLLKKTVVKSAL